MQVKVFKFDKNGKVSFTQEELEKLLNEVYRGGYDDGKRSNNYWTWTSPYWTWSNSTINTTTSEPNPRITWTTTTNNSDNTITVSMCTEDTNVVSINKDVSFVQNDYVVSATKK